ncbi:glycosyltransferase [Streptomyces albulus]|nr:glycosyltransferase [Streptomyces noursei]
MAGPRHPPDAAVRPPATGPAGPARRPHLVHAHGPRAGYTARMALRGRIPTVHQPHCWPFEVVGGLAARVWERYAARWTHRVLCVSEAQRRRGAAVGVTGRWVVIPNGVDLRRFAPAADAADDAREALREALPGLRDAVPVGAPLVVCVARLCAQKGQSTLLRAWPEVAAAVRDARLVLVGDGPDRAALQRSAPPGWCSPAPPTVPPLVPGGGPGGGAVAVGGMALVPLEAMACGIPVVLSDVGGARSACRPMPRTTAWCRRTTRPPWPGPDRPAVRPRPAGRARRPAGGARADGPRRAADRGRGAQRLPRTARRTARPDHDADRSMSADRADAPARHAGTLPRPAALGRPPCPASAAPPAPVRAGRPLPRRAAPILLATADALATAGATLLVGADPAVLAGLVPVLLLLNARAGLYRPGPAPAALDETAPLVGRAATAWCATAAALAALRPGDALGPVALPAAVAATAVLAGAGRAVVYRVRRAAARRRPRSVLLVGPEPAGRQLAVALLAHPEYGLHPVGVVATGPAGPDGVPPGAGPPLLRPPRR